MIHIGSTLYGKVDHVPGLFHVATDFLTINLIPVIPRGSYLVLETPDTEPIAVPLRWKSVLFALVRFILALAALISSLVVGIEFFEKRVPLGDGWPLLAALTVGLVLLFLCFRWTYSFTRAHPLKALEWARIANIPPEVVAQYFVADPRVDQLLEELNHG